VDKTRWTNGENYGSHPGERGQWFETAWQSWRCPDDEYISKIQTGRFMEGLNVRCEGRRGVTDDSSFPSSMYIRIRL
jgi:hypothetical protein